MQLERQSNFHGFRIQWLRDILKFMRQSGEGMLANGFERRTEGFYILFSKDIHRSSQSAKRF